MACIYLLWLWLSLAETTKEEEEKEKPLEQHGGHYKNYKLLMRIMYMINDNWIVRRGFFYIFELKIWKKKQNKNWIEKRAE